jgi:hypothetical protein
MVVDPDGYSWMVGTHRAEPTLQDRSRSLLSSFPLASIRSLLPGSMGALIER